MTEQLQLVEYAIECITITTAYLHMSALCNSHRNQMIFSESELQLNQKQFYLIQPGTYDGNYVQR